MSNYSSIEQQETSNTVSTVRAVQVSIVSTIIFIILLAFLHVIKPEIDPSWRFISEYAIGQNGWLMTVAFLALGLSYMSLSVSLRPHAVTLAGKIGLIALLISGAGLIIAGIFKTDPITASEAEHTTSGALHSFGGGLGIAIPVAAIFICIALRKNARWNSFKKPLLLATTVAIAGFLFGFVSLGVLMSVSEGKFGPNVLVGWPNRIEIISYCVWLLVVASQARRVNASSH